MPQIDRHQRAPQGAPCPRPLEALEPRLLLAGTPPVAVDDSAQTDLGVSVDVQVLLNDYDVDDAIDGTTLAVVTGPANGSAIANPSLGTITYYPTFSTPGIDTFTYTVQDAAGNLSNAATVTVKVGNFAPTAVNDSAQVVEMGSVQIPVLNNDIDPEGSLDPSTVQIVNWPVYGSAMVYTGGIISFTAFSAYTGWDSLTYTVRDAAGNLSNEATVNIQIVANTPPVANDDSAQTEPMMPVNIPVLDNDTDAEGNLNPFSLTITAQPANGTAFVDGETGILSYTPYSIFTSGTDTFRYTVSDAVGAVSNEALVTVQVRPPNTPPTASASSLIIDEDLPGSGSVSGDDLDGDSLTFEKTSDPPHGTLLFNPDGTFSYTPSPDWNGWLSFQFVAYDGQAYSGPASVIITVNPINDAPTVGNASLATDEDAPAGGSVGGSDIEGDPLSFVTGATPLNGTLDFRSDGTYTYTPDPNYFGGDSFTFKAFDGVDYSAEATVTITVNSINDAPTALDRTELTDEDTSFSSQVYGLDVEGDTLSFSLAASPTHGALQFFSDGTFSYTPDANFNEQDSFTFTAFDGLASSAPAQVTIDIAPVNDPPLAQDGSAQTDEDTPVGGWMQGSDVDSLYLTYQVTALPGHGSLVSDSFGAFTYTPDADFFGEDSFSFLVSDGLADSALATFTITVLPVNDPPTATAASFSGGYGQPISDRLAGTDVEGDPLMFVPDTLPQHGSLNLLSDGTFTYTPDLGYSGPDSFTFTVSDGSATSSPATVSLNVLPGNFAPLAEGQLVRMTGQPFIDIVLVGSDAETPASGLTFQVASAPAHGSVSLSGNVARYTPTTPWGGLDTFSFLVTDPQGLPSSPAQVAIDVPLLFNAQRTASFRNAGGDRIVLSLAGPGYGLAYLSASGADHIRQLNLLNTSLRTAVFVLSATTKAPTMVEGVDVSGPLQSLIAKALDLAGAANFQASLGTLWLNDVIGPASINIQGTGLPSNLYFREVRDLSVTAAGKLGTVWARRWLDRDATSDSIQASSLDRLLISGDAGRRIPGDFEADLNLTGSTPGYDITGLYAQTAGRSLGASPALSTLLGTAAIDGSLRDAVWQVAGSARQVLVGGAASNWNCSVSGDLSLATLKAVQGSQVRITGLLANLMADSFAASLLQAARIDQLLVRGNFVTSSLDVSGTGSGRAALGLARVLGRVQDSGWTVNGSAGTVRAGSADTWDFRVAGDLVDLLVGQVNASALAVDGLLRKGFSGAWDGGSIRAGRAGTIHIGGDLRADVTINPLAQSVIGRVLNALAVCGAVESSIISVLGDAGLIHFRSMLDTQVNLGAGYPAVGEYSMGESSRPGLDLLVLGYPYQGQSVVNSTIRAGDIDAAYFVGKLSLSGLTVEYSSINYRSPRTVSGVNWVQV